MNNSNYHSLVLSEMTLDLMPEAMRNVVLLDLPLTEGAVQCSLVFLATHRAGVRRFLTAEEQTEVDSAARRVIERFLAKEDVEQ